MNGTPVVQSPYQETIIGDALRFFVDNNGEESAGAVSCIRVYSDILTDAEIAEDRRQRDVPGAAEAQPAKRQNRPGGARSTDKKHRSAVSPGKCKKHKKKR